MSEYADKGTKNLINHIMSDDEYCTNSGKDLRTLVSEARARADEYKAAKNELVQVAEALACIRALLDHH